MPKIPSALSAKSGAAGEPKDFDWLRKNIPCQHACPAGTDIPGYLAAISQGAHDRAYLINLRDNVFPGVLGRVCARPCEPPCRHGWQDLGEPLAICFSKRAAADLGSRGPVKLEPLSGSTGKRVAIVGGGVAGLTVARTLALWGHRAVVFEAEARPGGMLVQGIPAFRLPREVVEREIKQVELCGVEIRCGVAIGNKLAVQELRRDFDAVVLAAGNMRPRLPDYPGVDLPGVEAGLPFLTAVNEAGRVEIGRRVAVIGGGFTAIDCARVALRLGAAEVAVYYRRSNEELRVTPGEVEELQREGVPLHYLARPVEFLGAQRRLSAVRFVRTRLVESDAGGHKELEDVPGSEFEVSADTVLLAVGQEAETSWLEPAWLSSSPGAEGKLNLERMAVEGFFAAGDFATGSTTVIEAVGHAKACAENVDYFLMGSARMQAAVVIEDGRDLARTRALDEVPRQAMPDTPVKERTLLKEVELGYAETAAGCEAQRCYLCHYKYEIDVDRCIYCNQCIEVKPRPNCILTVRRLITSGDGCIKGYERNPEDVSNQARLFYYYINQEDCIRCNACLEVCPVKCISVQKVSLKQGVS